MNDELYNIAVSEGEPLKKALIEYVKNKPEWSEEYFSMIDWDKEE